jgi:hypothetical protein
LVITALNPQPAYLDYIVYESLNTSLDAGGIDQPVPEPINPAPKKSSTSAIVGGVLGGLAFLILVGALVYYLRRRRPVQFERSDSEYSIKVIPMSPFTIEPSHGGGQPAQRKGMFDSHPVGLALTSNGILQRDQHCDLTESIPDTCDPSAEDSAGTNDLRSQPLSSLQPSSTRLKRGSNLHSPVPRNSVRDIGGLPRQHASLVADITSNDLMPPPPAYYDTRKHENRGFL